MQVALPSGAACGSQVSLVSKASSALLRKQEWISMGEGCLYMKQFRVETQIISRKEAVKPAAIKKTFL